MKPSLILLCLSLACVSSSVAQDEEQQPQQQQPVDLPPTILVPSAGASNPVTLGVPYEGTTNFVNFNAMINGVIDTNAPVFTNSSPTPSNQLGTGFEVGGGVTLNHEWARSTLSLSYHGDYSDYQTTFYPSGWSQNLGLAYNKILSRRWSLRYGLNGSQYLYGVVYAPNQPNVQVNPLSNGAKFASTSIGLTYQQSLRLSYSITGDLFLSRYTALAAIGSFGGGGSASVSYRMTRRTTLSGTYSRSQFKFQANAGNSSVDSYFGTISHIFASHWQVGASGGISRTSSTGALFSPYATLASNPLLSSILGVNVYNTKATVPYFNVSASRAWKHSTFGASAGQDISAGNGTYLTSRSIFVNGFYSRQYRRASLGFSTYYARLSSVSLTLAGSYSSYNFDAMYSYNFSRYIGMLARYDYTYYGTLANVGGRSDNRITFGVTFHTKDIPATIF